MIDDEIRELERARAEHPGDSVVHERWRRAMDRAGRYDEGRRPCVECPAAPPNVPRFVRPPDTEHYVYVEPKELRSFGYPDPPEQPGARIRHAATVTVCPYCKRRLDSPLERYSEISLDHGLSIGDPVGIDSNGGVRRARPGDQILGMATGPSTITLTYNPPQRLLHRAESGEVTVPPERVGAVIAQIDHTQQFLSAMVATGEASQAEVIVNEEGELEARIGVNRPADHVTFTFKVADRPDEAEGDQRARLADFVSGPLGEPYEAEGEKDV